MCTKTLRIHAIFFACILCSTVLVNAQGFDNENVLNDLNKSLFSENKDMVEVSTFFGNGRNKQRMDSIYFLRKAQPSFDSILPILKKIAYSKDVGLLSRVVEIYNKQQLLFEKEWEPVHRQNLYACNEANRQFWILEAFEETIHSLKFEKLNLSPKDKFLYFKDYSQYRHDYYRVKGAWKEALDGWRIHSPYYMELRKNRWVAPPLSGFLFIEPYLNEIEDFIVEDYMLNYQPGIYDKMELPIHYFSFLSLCGIISFSENVKFNPKIVDAILMQKENNRRHVRSQVLNLIRNPTYKKQIKGVLLSKAKSEVGHIRLNALRGLLFFHEEAVLKLYRKLITKHEIDEVEKEAIKLHLSILDQQRAASQKVKRMGKRLLKKIDK